MRHSRAGHRRHGVTSPPRFRCELRRKLTPDQEAAIRSLAGTKSLRALAADFGVSHETVRAVLRRPGTATTD